MIETTWAVRTAVLGLFAVLGFHALPSCDATGGGDGGDGGGEVGGEGVGDGPAPSADQGRCKEACNKLKFFDCNDAADHAACFESCESAPADAIELFVACVENDTCDPECSTNLQADAPDPVDMTEGGGEEGGGAQTCPEACASFIADGCAPPVDCNGICASLTDLEQAFVGYCLERRDGCALPMECVDLFEDIGSGEGGPIEEGGGVEEGGGEVGGAGG